MIDKDILSARPSRVSNRPEVIELIPDKDFLVLFLGDGVEVPDADTMDELAVQADQRCAPKALGGLAEAGTTVVELIAAGVLTNGIWASFPSARRYAHQIRQRLYGHSSASDGGTDGAAQHPPSMEPSAAAEVLHSAVAAAAGEPDEPVEPRRSGPAETWSAVVRVGDLTVDVHAEPAGRIVSVTIRDA